jgi:hypothetical protein
LVETGSDVGIGFFYNPASKVVARCQTNGTYDHPIAAVNLSTGALAAVVEAVQPALLVPVEDLVAGDPGDAELPAQGRHLLAFQQAGYKSEAFIHRFTLVPGHLGALPQMRKCVNHVLGIICKLSVDKLNR